MNPHSFIGKEDVDAFIENREGFGSCCGRMGAGRVTSWGEGGGDDSRPRLYGGRLYTGTTEGGMGPRIREDNEGKGWVPALVSTGAGSTRE